MARFKDREKALALRKKEMSYSQIKKILGVSKSTLSLWLRDYPLSKKRIRSLRDCNEKRIESYRETMRKKREARWNEVYKKEKKRIFPFSDREFFIAGLFLYWGEGGKTAVTEVNMSNTDPSTLNFFIKWAIKFLKIEREEIRIQLHLYQNMSIKEETEYWSKTLNISIDQFRKPYIKKTSSERINHKGSFGHGTCQARIYNARLSEKVLMGIKVIKDRYKGMRL